MDSSHRQRSSREGQAAGAATSPAREGLRACGCPECDAEEHGRA